ncbi:sensor histidine kinase [Lunatibacter salilacus]|uniref:sensor histidine kinase n=1 Tax=Lunatibacter salilacus TaxID=2483804 RepID=UPI00131EC949|nr:ATP-binding protein [Lunatibacter salilacus]
MKPELKLTIFYTGIGVLWILLSDFLLKWFFDDKNIVNYQTYKGITYVVATGALLYLLAKRYNNSIQEKILELEKLNAKLQIQTRNLTASNAELEQFAYTASHDLQEPLRMVTSFMAQLERKYDDKLDEKAHQYIHFAIDGAKRMRKIILDLLEFSRVGKEKGALEIVSLEEICGEICDELSSKITETGAIIEHSGLPKIYSFRHPLQQVLFHLLENALIFCKEGVTPKVSVSCDEHPNYWQIAVADNGIGIEDVYMDKAFIIFQQLNPILNPEGSGMGLAIVKKIIDTLNGQVWVMSSPEKGSTFYFTLPKNNSIL